MGKFDQKKEFHKLEFYVWRVKYLPKDKWNEEIFLNGSDQALNTFITSLRSMLDTYETYMKGTRKFKVNKPKNIDFEEYGQANKAKFEWFIVKLTPVAQENERYVITDKNVYNPC